MTNKIVIADTGVIISLSTIKQLDLLNQIFGEYYIAKAVWFELLKYKSIISEDIFDVLHSRVKDIGGINYLSVMMDYGESESVILYNELNADFFLVDDKKARIIAESLGVKCIGTLGVISIAKEKGMIAQLKPLFEKLLENKRYYSVDVLNKILMNYKETRIIGF